MMPAVWPEDTSEKRRMKLPLILRVVVAVPVVLEIPVIPPVVAAEKVMALVVSVPTLLFRMLTVFITAPWLVTPTIPPRVAAEVLPLTSLSVMFTVPKAAVLRRPNRVMAFGAAPGIEQF